MQLEDCFEFERFETKFGPVERIRIKGHRIAIEHVLEAFNSGTPPARIQSEVYPSLTLAEVYATIAYYLLNKDAVDQYLRRGEDVADAYYQEWLKQEPSPLRKRLLELRARQREVGGDG
jgi:uncharacterized protein (DUF433 family)